MSKITNDRNIESIIANNISIPFKSNSIDILLSIAVIHHLSTNENRIRALNEMIRILKPDVTLSDEIGDANSVFLEIIKNR